MARLQPAQNAALVAEGETNPFFSARDLKAVPGFLRGKHDYFETYGSRSQSTACCGGGSHL